MTKEEAKKIIDYEFKNYFTPEFLSILEVYLTSENSGPISLIKNYEITQTFIGTSLTVWAHQHNFTKIFSIETFVNDSGFQEKNSSFDITLDSANNITINKRSASSLFLTVKILGLI